MPLMLTPLSRQLARRAVAGLGGCVFPVLGSEEPPRRCRVSGSPAGVVPVKGSDAAAQSAEERRCASADEAVAATRPPGVSPVDSVASVASSRGTTDTNQSQPVPSGRTEPFSPGERSVAALTARKFREKKSDPPVLGRACGAITMTSSYVKRPGQWVFLASAAPAENWRIRFLFSEFAGREGRN